MAQAVTSDPLFAHLLTQRAHHAEQLRRIDDAISLLKDAGKVAVKASKMAGKVQARAGLSPSGRPQPTATAYVQEHADLRAESPKAEVMRLFRKARSEGFAIGEPGLQAAFYALRSGKATYSAAGKRSGSTPHSHAKHAKQPAQRVDLRTATK